MDFFKVLEYTSLARKVLLNQPKPKLSKEDQKLALAENKRINELQHSLVVKIISWKSGPMAGASITEANKITPKEWKAYQTHILTISKTESSSRVKDKLQETYNSIKRNGGFK